MKGSRNRATVILDALAEADAAAVLAKVTEAAKAGDLRAAEILLARVWPPKKGRPVALDMPTVTSAADVLAALGNIADAVAAGDLTPDEGQAVAAVIEAKRRAIETIELERRIAALEQQKAPTR
ncbi:MAG: hypothetical protein IT556_03550 [Acetobacteraceae bacterium]|nr:hypothetical protein [Acetobacteraceae bacterium]